MARGPQVKPPCYSGKLDEALGLAADAFRDRRRKGTGIPYLSHLLQVMVWVAENGGDEEQMIAALLHDYLEDIEGSSAEALEQCFGPRVRRLVEALSDSQTHPKPPWRERKDLYLAHLERAPAEVKLVCACDKLHNARSILRDLETEGEALWDRFNAGRDETLWYYGAVLGALEAGWDHALIGFLREAVTAIHRRVGRGPG